MSEYLDNPLFNDQIIRFDGATPNINFQYKWDTEIDKWVPHTGEAISVGDVTIGDIDLSDEQTHALLTSLIDSVDGVEGSLTDIKELTETTHTMFGSNHAHLQAIKTAIDSFKDDNAEDLTTLIGLGEAGNAFLSLINSSTADSLNELLEVNAGLASLLAKNTEILSSTQNLEVLTSDSNTLLNEVKEGVEALSIEVGDIAEDKEAHRILSGISGQDDANYEESQRLLRHIKNNTCHQTLALEELKKNYRDLTYHIKKFEEENIVQEAQGFTDDSEETFKNRLLNKIPYNGRLTDRTSPEKSQYPIVTENFSSEEGEREYVFDEGMPFSIKMENYKGGEEGWHSLFPFDKRLGADDKVTIYNESVFPLQIMFRGGDEFIVNEGISVELTKEEASQLYIKRDYTISGFEVRYAIERMYTPEENVEIQAGDPEFLSPEQTHARLGLGKISADEGHVYIAYGNEWKRIAIAEWEQCENKTLNSFSIDYFDAYSSPGYLYLNTIWGKKRVAIAEWSTCSNRPTECYSEIWADDKFLYARGAGKKGEEWRRYAISSYE
jgi:hypothetical protein